MGHVSQRKKNCFAIHVSWLKNKFHISLKLESNKYNIIIIGLLRVFECMAQYLRFEFSSLAGS
jgi:hypothetical protein